MTDAGESQYLELRRSSRTEVSQGIAAIDDERTVAVERRGCIAQDAAEPNVNSAADVGGVVLVRRQDLNDLRAGRDHLGKFAMLNLAHGLRAHRGERGEGGLDHRLAAAGRNSRGVNLITTLGAGGAGGNVAD